MASARTPESRARIRRWSRVESIGLVVALAGHALLVVALIATIVVAVWFDLGRASRLRALDVANHEVLAATMYDELAGRGLIPASPVARTIAMANWELADALIGLAFRIDPDGDDATLAYVRHLLRLASSPTLEVIATMAATMPGR